MTDEFNAEAFDGAPAGNDEFMAIAFDEVIEPKPFEDGEKLVRVQSATLKYTNKEPKRPMLKVLLIAVDNPNGMYTPMTEHVMLPADPDAKGYQFFLRNLKHLAVCFELVEADENGNVAAGQLRMQQDGDNVIFPELVGKEGWVNFKIETDGEYGDQNRVRRWMPPKTKGLEL